MAPLFRRGAASLAISMVSISLVLAVLATPNAATHPSMTQQPARAGATEAFQELASKVRMKTLPNGLRVIIVPRGEAPVVSFHTYVDVGSVDEKPGITGIAHMFEHMAFKGSSRIGSKNWEDEKRLLAAEEKAYNAWRAASDAKDPKADVLKGDSSTRASSRSRWCRARSTRRPSIAKGVGLNASTNTDATQYFYSLPSNKIELWAWLESERFADPVLREFYKERDVVQEERRLRTDSNPMGKMIEEALMASFEDHPYGRPVIGYQKDLEHFSRSEAEAFYKQTYGPSKMVLAIVGKVDPDKTFDLIERYFSRIPKNDPVPSPAQPAARKDGEKRIEVPLAAQPIYLASYRRPGVRSADDAVYSVIADILGGGEHSRLYKALVKSGTAVACQAILVFPGEKYSTGFVVFCVPARDKTLEECEKAIDAELSRLAKDGPTAEELEGVRLRAKAGFLDGIESNSGLARELSRNEAIGGGWKETFAEIAKIDAVTADRVKAVAASTFDTKNRTVATIKSLPAKGRGAAPAGNGK